MARIEQAGWGELWFSWLGRPGRRPLTRTVGQRYSIASVAGKAVTMNRLGAWPA